MRRHQIALVIASILVLVSLAPAHGKIKTSFNLMYWLARGYLNWTVAGLTEDLYVPGSLTPFRSELDWDVNSNMVVLRVGIKGEIQPASLVRLNANIGYWPSLDIEGEGFWNLRTDVDPSGWRFYDSGKGNSLEYNLVVGIVPVRSLSVELGYRSQVFKVTESKGWENCEAKQSGLFINGTFKF